MYTPKITDHRVSFFVSNFSEYFKSASTMVEMGAHYGDLSRLLYEKFPNFENILCEEGRVGNYEKGKEVSQFEWLLINYEKSDLENLRLVDIVVNFGLLYHISVSKSEELILSSIKRANKICFLETEVLDCDNESCYVEHDGAPEKNDKAMVSLEIRPSIKYIEDILDKSDCIKWERYNKSDFNIENYIYDWVPTNSKTYTAGGQRKFWIIYK